MWGYDTRCGYGGFEAGLNPARVKSRKETSAFGLGFAWETQWKHSEGGSSTLRTALSVGLPGHKGRKVQPKNWKHQGRLQTTNAPCGPAQGQEICWRRKIYPSSGKSEPFFGARPFTFCRWNKLYVRTALLRTCLSSTSHHAFVVSAVVWSGECFCVREIKSNSRKYSFCLDHSTGM